MLKTLILILAIVAFAALTSCGVKGDPELKEGEQRGTVF